MLNKRTFMKKLLGISIIAIAPRAIKSVLASERVVSESDPLAREINYVTDSTKISKVQFNFYVVGSNCSTCKWFIALADSNQGHCAMYFPDALVSAEGWCVGWNSKKGPSQKTDNTFR